MKYPGYDTGKIILSEGKWYTFRIHNHVQLQDGNWYYVLEDINGLKHFLAAEHYTGYNLVKGEEISCRIDRINCTGRIFLEPKHPFYTVDAIYSFEVEMFSNQGDSNILSVKDILGNSIQVQDCGFLESASDSKNRVKCKVLGIKKGRPSLAIYSSNA